VGVGNGTIRHCALGNLVIPAARHGIHLVCRYSPRIAGGVRIEDVSFSNVVMDAVLPLFAHVGEGAERPAAIDRVSFSHVRVRADSGCYVAGNPDLPVRHLRFIDWDMVLYGGSDSEAFAAGPPNPLPLEARWTPGHTGDRTAAAMPAAIYATCLEDVAFDGLRVRWEGELGRAWRDGLFLDRADGVDLRGLHLGPPRADGAAVRLRHARAVSLRGCRAAAGTGTFLHMEDTPADAAPTALVGNDLQAAKTPARADGAVLQVGNLTADAGEG